MAGNEATSSSIFSIVSAKLSLWLYMKLDMYMQYSYSPWILITRGKNGKKFLLEFTFVSLSFRGKQDLRLIKSQGSAVVALATLIQINIIALGLNIYTVSQITFFFYSLHEYVLEAISETFP